MTNEMPKEEPVMVMTPQEIGEAWLRDSRLENWFPMTSEELTQLRARVKELEASRSLVAMDQLIRITEQNLELKARIRELEAAMIEVKEKLLEPGWPEDKDLPGIADIIEAVMRKEGNE